MEVILIALLAIAVIAFVAYPLFSAPPATRRARGGARPPENGLDALLAQRNATYDAIRDLDFDYQLGKLSPSDYESLREQYKVRAAALLQQIDSLAGSSDGAGERIEEEVTRLRQARPRKEDSIEQEVARLRGRKDSKRHCPRCGRGHLAGDRFCAQCGSPLPA